MLINVIVVGILLACLLAVLLNWFDKLPHSRRCERVDCDRPRCLQRETERAERARARLRHPVAGNHRL